jgi:hypothetical protein
MNNNRRETRGFALLVLVAVVALAGCATTPKQAYNRTANPDIKVVGLLEPNLVVEYPVLNLGHAGNAFGLIGGLIAMSDMQGKTKEFTAAAMVRGFDLSADFRQQMVAAIEARGYRVKLLTVERIKSGFLESYDSLDKEPDAYVDATVSGGYLCASGTADYFPSVQVGIRIVKRATREVVYQERIAYGYEIRFGQPVQITADIKYQFKDFPALMADVPLAVDGLRAGVPKVVAQVGRDISQ